MRRLYLILPSIGLVLLDYQSAWAMNSTEYGVLQELLSLSMLVIGLILILSIFYGLRGGAFSRAWAFFIVAIILAGAASLLHLLDLKGIIFKEYDLRPALLVIRSAAMLFVLVGLIFYKKELQ